LLRSLSSLEVITYNGGQVASIAVLVFLAGRVRRSSKLANFVIHKSTASFPAPATADDMEAGIKVARHNDEVIESVLHTQLKMPKEKGDYPLKTNYWQDQ
jgi:ATP-dependent Clp protease protease subunit